MNTDPRAPHPDSSPPDSKDLLRDPMAFVKAELVARPAEWVFFLGLFVALWLALQHPSSTVRGPASSSVMVLWLIPMLVFLFYSPHLASVMQHGLSKKVRLTLMIVLGVVPCGWLSFQIVTSPGIPLLFGILYVVALLFGTALLVRQPQLCWLPVTVATLFMILP